MISSFLSKRPRITLHLHLFAYWKSVGFLYFFFGNQNINDNNRAFKGTGERY
jgi:hypothetical protein